MISLHELTIIRHTDIILPKTIAPPYTKNSYVNKELWIVGNRVRYCIIFIIVLSTTKTDRPERSYILT
jgi:hypothetical protein